MKTSTCHVAQPGSRKPNKERFKAAVIGCMRASTEEEVKLWNDLLWEEILLYKELEGLPRKDRDEIRAFLVGEPQVVRHVGRGVERSVVWEIDAQST